MKRHINVHHAKVELICKHAHLGCPYTTLRDCSLTAHEQIFCDFTSDEVKAQQGKHCPIADCPFVSDNKAKPKPATQPRRKAATPHVPAKTGVRKPARRR